MLVRLLLPKGSGSYCSRCREDTTAWTSVRARQPARIPWTWVALAQAWATCGMCATNGMGSLWVWHAAHQGGERTSNIALDRAGNRKPRSQPDR